MYLIFSSIGSIVGTLGMNFNKKIKIVLQVNIKKFISFSWNPWIHTYPPYNLLLCMSVLPVV